MSPASPVPPRDRARGAELVFALVAVALAAFFQLLAAWPGLHREASDRAEILSAITIRSLTADGVQLDYPTPVLGKPWKIPSDFGLYPNVAALGARVTGADPEFVGRVVALLAFYLGVPAVFLVARRLGAGRAGGLLAVAFWLVSPLAEVHANALTGLTTALTLSTWWLWLFLGAVDAPCLRNWILSGFAGALAAMCGPVVFIPFALVGLARGLEAGRRAARRSVVSISLAAGLLPALAGALGWAIHADALKAANPYGSLLAASTFWSAAVGTWAQRREFDFVVSLLGTLFGTLVAPLSALLALVCANFSPARRPGVRLRIGIVALVMLALLQPLYETQPGQLGPLVLLTALALAGFAEDILGSRLPVGWIAVIFMLLAQAQLRIQPAEELHSPLPDADNLSPAVTLVTRPTDIVVTAGQDIDLLFAYRVNRRTILVPAGRETDTAALTQALGSRTDWNVGAVVLTGRYRSEPAIVASLHQLFNLAEKPLLQTSASDVYFPAAADADASARLRGSMYAGLLRRDSNGPPPPPAKVTPPPKPAKVELPPFSMMSPQPNRYSVPYDVAAHEVDGVPCFFAHAPTTLEFDLPTGGTQCVLEFFMSEGSYTGKGDTDGADVVVTVRHAKGGREEVFRRHLDPVNRRADRKLQTASIVFRAEPASTLLVESQPGPRDRANFDWVYFRKIEIK